MLHSLKQKLKSYYYLKIKKLSASDYNIMLMRNSGIKVGENCRIFSRITTTEPFLVAIGNRVTISSDVEFCTHDNGIIKVIPGKTDAVGPISVGNDCFIGMHSILMLGVSLGDNCIVGAGSVVTHSFPPHTVLAGNPARAICTTEEYAEKYMKYAIDFSRIPHSARSAYLSSHPNLLVKR